MLSEQQPETISEWNGLIQLETTLEDYMENYAQYGYEFFEGKVYKSAPIGLRHERIRDYLRLLLQAYFVLKPIGTVIGEPFVMYLPEFPNRRREPDLMVILESNPHPLKETHMDGPADICIEIVSPGSVSIDHGDKFDEYEKGGVQEYWIIDPIRNECRFYRLNSEGVYVPQAKDTETYVTPILPDLKIETTIFWEETLPNVLEVIESVKTMLKEKED